MIRADISPQIQGAGRFIATVAEYHALAARCGSSSEIAIDPTEIRTAACAVAGIDNAELYRLANALDAAGPVIDDTVVAGMSAASVVLGIGEGIISQAMGMLSGLLGVQQTAHSTVSESARACAEAMAEVMGSTNNSVDFLADTVAGVVERALLVLPTMPRPLDAIGAKAVGHIVSLVGQKLLEVFASRDHFLERCYDLLYKHCAEELTEVKDGGVPRLCTDAEVSTAAEAAPVAEPAAVAEPESVTEPESVDSAESPQTTTEQCHEPVEPCTSVPGAVDDCSDNTGLSSESAEISVESAEATTASTAQECSSVSSSETSSEGPEVQPAVVQPANDMDISVDSVGEALQSSTSDTWESAATPSPSETPTDAAAPSSPAAPEVPTMQEAPPVSEATQTAAPELDTSTEESHSSTQPAPEPSSQPAPPQQPSSPPESGNSTDRIDLAHTGSGITIEKAGEW